MANNISFAVLPKSPILKHKPLVNNVYMDAIVFLCRPYFLYYTKKEKKNINQLLNTMFFSSLNTIGPGSVTIRDNAP